MLATDVRDGSIDFEKRSLSDIGDYIKAKCGPIIKITSDGDVEFVHSSARRYATLFLAFGFRHFSRFQG